ncbi:MAG TPA: ribulose-phosphate 3-epimerase [Fimbriimonas sp.]|nr:ribulose-phosphate 3-epimerase [Fimbriimonas sp.]
MNIELAPSVLSFDLTTLSQSVKSLEQGGADIIHLDVMDGQFVPPISFGDCLAASLRHHTKMRMEAHLMTLNPERQFDAFQSAGCERIIFHAEATHHAHRLIQDLHGRGLKAGIALNPGTSVSVVEELLPEVDLVLIMTVNPGWGGQKFIESTMAKIAEIRSVFPDLEIQVDGGIDPRTIGTAYTAGASSFVVGSYLLRAQSIEEGLKCLRQSV